MSMKPRERESFSSSNATVYYVIDKKIHIFNKPNKSIRRNKVNQGLWM